MTRTAAFSLGMLTGTVLVGYEALANGTPVVQYGPAIREAPQGSGQ